MKKGIVCVLVLMAFLTSCRDNDINLFDKSADERVAEAIANFKADLVAPRNGWRLRYQPEPTSGAFYVLMDFKDDNTVNIKTDLGANNGEFFDQTITYRIDNSLGLELIMESYCFFSYLFEQNQASFGAEYEFLFTRKTDEGNLVFESKTDFTNPTILVFEEADEDDEEQILARTLATNINTISDDLDHFTPSFKLTYDDKNLILYLSLDELARTIYIKSGTRKDNTQYTNVSFSSPYVLKNDSLIFSTPLQGNIAGISVSIQRIFFGGLSTSELNICASPITTHGIDGVTSSGDNVMLESTLSDADGARFAQVSTIFAADVRNIFVDGRSVGTQVLADLPNAIFMVMYYNNNGLYGLGFVMQNPDESITIAVRRFTSVVIGNKVTFTLDPAITIVRGPGAPSDFTAMNTYIDALTGGGNTFVFKYSESIYEFYNPCTETAVAFEAI